MGKLIRIKPLEWFDCEGGQYSDTAFGIVVIESRADGCSVVLQGGERIGQFSSKEAAKTIIQDMHVDWILDWIDDSDTIIGEHDD